MKECSTFTPPTVRYRPLHSDNNIFFNRLQNHSRIKLLTHFINEFLVNLYTKFYPRTVFQS